jgi:hypothetical protein
MRKATVVLVALALTAALFAVAGCGGNEGAAKSYMNKGDALLKKVETQYTTISTKTTKLIGDYTGGKNTEPAGVKARITEITGLLDKAKAMGASARAQYGKILPLTGVPDYVAYAKLQIKVINDLAKANEYIRGILAAVQVSSTTGKAPDVSKITSLSDQIQKLSNEIDALLKQANDLKKSKDLG